MRSCGECRPRSWLDLLDSGSEGQWGLASCTESPWAAVRTLSARDAADILLYMVLGCYTTHAHNILVKRKSKMTNYERYSRQLFSITIYITLSHDSDEGRAHFATEGGHSFTAVWYSVDLGVNGGETWRRGWSVVGVAWYSWQQDAS